jgi:hypothetical protein
MNETTDAEATDPRALLAETRQLVTKVRRSQGVGWLTLVVFGALTLVATPFMRYGAHPSHCATHTANTSLCVIYPTLALWYWPIALVAGYAAVTLYAVGRSRTIGVSPRIAGYVAVGVIVGLLGTAWTAWSYTHPDFIAHTQNLTALGTGFPLLRLAGPAAVIGLALVLLAWKARDALLAVVAVVYLGVVVWGPTQHSTLPPGQAPSSPISASPWAFLPHLLSEAVVLLVGAGVIALWRLAKRRSS